MQSAKRYSQVAVAGVALAALVTGCGSSSGGGKAASSVGPKTVNPTSGSGGGGQSIQELLASSVDKTESAKNAKLHLDFTGDIAGKNLTFGGDGIADFAGKKFQLTLNLPAESGVSGTIEELVIGQTIYLKLPAAAASALGGKSWVKIDTSSLGSSSSGLGSLGQDPTQYLSTLKNVSDSVTKVGMANVRGVETTHYRAQVDLAKAVAASGASGSDAALGEIQKVLGTSTLPEDVYLDGQGLARRVSVTITPHIPTSSTSPGSATDTSTGTISTTVDFYDFGTTDTSGIVAPPASEVGSLPTGATGITG